MSRRPATEVKDLFADLHQVYFDRSRAAADEECRRKRYIANEYCGVGLEGQGDPETKLYLPMGSAIHKAVEVLAKGGTGTEAASDALADFVPLLAIPGMSQTEQTEQEYMLRGLILGYARAIWPLDLEEYRILSVEDEVVVLFPDGEQVLAKPDLLLERKSDRSVIYKEYKSTHWANEGWVRSFSRAAQLLTGALATQVSTGRTLRASVIQGLYKGSKYKGRPTSPLIYGYRFPDGDWSTKWAKGAERIGVWEYPGGQSKWLEDFPLLELRTHFPATPEIPFNQPLLAEWLAGRFAREHEIAKVRSIEPLPQALLDQHFPMNTGACEPAMGSACPFLGFCYNPSAKADPLLQGFQWRQPHLASDPAHAIRKVLVGA